MKVTISLGRSSLKFFKLDAYALLKLCPPDALKTRPWTPLGVAEPNCVLTLGVASAIVKA